MKGHPGIVALFISLATATTLSFGLPSLIVATRIAKVVERIGDYSYSIYLAHFPVIVLFLYQPFHGTVLKSEGVAQFAMLFILVASASTLLFALVEKPGRTRIRTPITWSIASIVAVLAVSYIGSFVQQSRTPSNEMLIYEAWEDRDIYRCGKVNRIVDPFAISCEITVGIINPSQQVLFVGNSHADSIKATFRAVAEERNVAIRFLIDNDPLMKTGKTTPQALIDEALSHSVDLIVLHYAPDSIDIETIRLLANLAKSHQLRLSFVMPVPVWDRHIPMELLSNIQNGKGLPTQNKIHYLSSNSQLIEGLATISYDKFSAYHVDGVFCGNSPSDNCSIISENGRPLYFDTGHLTLTGSALLKDIFGRVLSDSSRKD